MENRNRTLLDQVNQRGRWIQATKTAPIWVKLLDEDQLIHTKEGPILAQAGEYHCRGVCGEQYPQSQSALYRKYIETPEIDEHQWIRFDPHPDPAISGIWAVRIDRPFQVQSDRGALQGQAGDFLAKPYSDKEVEYPEDLWIIDDEIFWDTYRIIETEEN